MVDENGKFMLSRKELDMLKSVSETLNRQVRINRGTMFQLDSAGKANSLQRKDLSDITSALTCASFKLEDVIKSALPVSEDDFYLLNRDHEQFRETL